MDTLFRLLADLANCNLRPRVGVVVRRRVVCTVGLLKPDTLPREQTDRSDVRIHCCCYEG